jgi:hypothetical protein
MMPAARPFVAGTRAAGHYVTRAGGRTPRPNRTRRILPAGIDDRRQRDSHGEAPAEPKARVGVTVTADGESRITPAGYLRTSRG